MLAIECPSVNRGRKKAGHCKGQSALGLMCDAEKDWPERFFRTSGYNPSVAYF